MATAIGDLVINLMARNQVSPVVQTVNSQMSMLGSMAGKLKGALFSALGVGGLIGGGSILAFMGKAISLSGEQARAEKKLQSVLTSTGGAAGLSAQEMFDYAKQLQAVTNYSDEATISAMGVMATFTSIKGDAFKGAIAAAQDLSTIMGQDLQSSVVQVGKALNDPIKGVTALRRVGVSFTKDQLTMIKRLQESGDLMGAQKIILDELAKEFGGSSKALASPVKQLQNALVDLMEKIGGAVRPALGAMARWLLVIVQNAWQATQPLRDLLAGLWGIAVAIAQSPVGQWVANFAKAALVGAALLALVPIVTTIGSALMTAFTIVMGPIGAVVLALAGLGAAIVYCYGEGDTFGQKLQSILAGIPALIDTLGFTFRNFSALAQVALIDIVLTAIEWFPQMTGPITKVAEFFIGTFAGIKAFFSSIIQNIIGGLQEIANFAKAVGAGLVAAFSAITSGNFSGIASAFGDAFVKELSSQADVAAPNAFNEFTKAYDEAAGSFRQKVDQSGGLKNLLAGRKQELIDQMGKNEAARLAAAGTAKKAEEQKKEQTPPPVAAAEATQFAGAQERGSKEAWSTILKAMGAGKGLDAVAANTAATADAAERTAEATERMADEVDEEVEIPA